MPAHGWEFTPLCKEGLTVEGDPTGEPPLHKEAQRGENSKAAKAQPPSPPSNVPWDHDGDRNCSIPAMGSWSKTQNTVLEQLLQPQGIPRCCGRAAGSWGTRSPGISTSTRQAPGWLRCNVPEGCAAVAWKWHCCGTRRAPGSLPQGALPAMHPGSHFSDGCFCAGKRQGCERADFPDAPVLLCRVSAQISPSVQADPTPTSPCVGEMHVQLCESIADLGRDGCAELYF